MALYLMHRFFLNILPTAIPLFCTYCVKYTRIKGNPCQEKHVFSRILRSDLWPVLCGKNFLKNLTLSQFAFFYINFLIYFLSNK